MKLQGNNYKSINLTASRDRYNSGKRLGDREVFSQTIDGKRYFSSLDAEIYLGDVFVDDVVNIQYVVQQNTLKIYGYNSYTFDDLALGSRIIEGSFTINYTKPGFMFDVLRATKPISRSKYYIDQDDSSNSNITWDSIFDKEHKPLWDRGFNIKIGFGDQKQEGPLTSMAVLYCVQLTGNQMIIGIDGQPIGESYSFIAKDLRYELGVLPEFTSEEKNKGNHNTDKGGEVKISHIMYEKDNNSNTPKWYLNMNIETANTHIDSIEYQVSTDTQDRMSNTYINIGQSSTGKVRAEVPSQIAFKIDQCIKKQKSMGVSDDNLLLYTSICMGYTINKASNDKGTFNKKNMLSKVVIDSSKSQ